VTTRDGIESGEWTAHHRLLVAIIQGQPGVTTEEIQDLYEALAPLAYQGTLATPVSARRWRRQLLTELDEAGAVIAYETARDRLWVPAEDTSDDRGCAAGLVVKPMSDAEGKQ